VSAAWAEVEYFLVLIAGQATATISSLHPKGGGSGRIGLVSRAAMNALESLSAKIGVARAILEVSVSPELLKEFEAMAPAIRRAAGMRNQIVHCRWHFTDNYPNDVLAPIDVMHGQYLRYNEADLEAIASRISKVSDSVHGFSARCFGHHVDEERRKAGQKPEG
jgi:hypothetical protein